MKELSEYQAKCLRNFGVTNTKKNYAKPSKRSKQLMIARKKVEELLEEKKLNKKFELF